MDQIIRRLRFRDLRLLTSLAGTRSLHRTADELGVTQPGVTKMLREIEAVFGCLLFSRTTRRVAPTAAGEVVIARAVAMLADLDLLRRQVDAARTGKAGQRRVGVIPYAAPALMPRVVWALMQSLPELQLVVAEGTTSTLLEQLRTGEIDLVLARRGVGGTPEALVERAIYREQGVVVASPAHPLARASSLEVARLAEFPWLLPPARSPTRLAIDVAFAPAKLAAPERTVESFSVSFLINLLGMSDLLSVLPQRIAEAQKELGTLAIIPAGFAVDLPDLCVFRRRDTLHDPLVEEVEREIARASHMDEVRAVSGAQNARRAVSAEH